MFNTDSCAREQELRPERASSATGGSAGKLDPWGATAGTPAWPERDPAWPGRDPAWPGRDPGIVFGSDSSGSHGEDTVLSHPSLFADTNGPCYQGPVHVNHTTLQEIFFKHLLVSSYSFPLGVCVFFFYNFILVFFISSSKFCRLHRNLLHGSLGETEVQGPHPSQ